MKYSKRIVNVTYSQVSDNIEVRTYPCLKFGRAYGVDLTEDQKETLRYRRIHFIVYKDSERKSGWNYHASVITRKGQWGQDIMENILKDIISKSGKFDYTANEKKFEMMVQDVFTKVEEHNKVMMGLIKPKATRDPKTGRFMKASA